MTGAGKHQSGALAPENEKSGSCITTTAGVKPSGRRQRQALLWKMDQARELFKSQRLWPSFVGAKNETGVAHKESSSSKTAVGLLPILLWPEQDALMLERGIDITNSPGITVEAVAALIAADAARAKLETPSKDHVQSKKRGREDLESPTPPVCADEDETRAQESQKRAKIDGVDREAQSAGGWNFLNSVGSFVWGWLSAPLSLFSSSSADASGSASASSSSSSSSGSSAPASKPLTNAEMQLTVFRECAQRGYFVGPGDVYGGDYNIYRGGDPSNTHSTATVRLVRKRAITGRDLLCFSRVQNQVAKSAVLAYVHPETQQAQFLVANFRNVSERV